MTITPEQDKRESSIGFPEIGVSVFGAGAGSEDWLLETTLRENIENISLGQYLNVKFRNIWTYLWSRIAKATAAWHKLDKDS